MTEQELLLAVAASATHWHRISSDPNSKIGDLHAAELGLRGTVEALAQTRQEVVVNHGKLVLTVMRRPVGGGPGDTAGGRSLNLLAKYVHHELTKSDTEDALDYALKVPKSDTE